MCAFYITTPIYYVNDIPHLGHAYTTIVADALARYHRARGRRVLFLTGTDEHGQKIERAAQARGEKPIELADRVVSRFRETWTALGVANDDFIRTTEERHARVVRAIWERMRASGDIYLGEYDGLYCVGCEEYFTEGQLAEGGKCPVHGTPVEHLRQPSYFFRMSRYQDRLLEHFEKNPGFVLPEIRKNEIASFVRGGLRDLSISRTTFRWGIEAPGDPAHVVYVWVDALTNYVSALGGFEGEPPPEKYASFWPVDVHLIGKDILRFHAVYWPAMLMSAGLPLPKCIFAHGWWTIDGQKMSKSLGNVVDPNSIAADVGRDALRYFLLRETPLGSDGDFSHVGLIQRINAELANDLGNLLQRSIAMAVKYVGGRVPAPVPLPAVEAIDRDFIALAERTREEAARQFEALAPSRALEATWELVRGTNKYIDQTAPYKLVKDPARGRRVEEVVANFLEALRTIALLVAPVMPDKAAEIEAQLGLAPRTGAGRWPEAWGDLPAGLELRPGPSLFPRIDDDRRQELLARWTAGKETAPAAPASTPGVGDARTEKVSKPVKDADAAKAAKDPKAPGAPKKAPPAGPAESVTYDEFARLDLRVALVASAAKVEGADRLLQLEVDLGTERRQVVAGIAEAYAPEEIVGKKVIFVANLAPAVIRGIRSEGMILAAGAKKVEALSALDRDVAPGTKVR
jgi:methionyl-tRNA synthetase